jgi:hypothetical protein
MLEPLSHYVFLLLYVSGSHLEPLSERLSKTVSERLSKTVSERLLERLSKSHPKSLLGRDLSGDWNRLGEIPSHAQAAQLFDESKSA